jgi:hypothetical protein
VTGEVMDDTAFLGFYLCPTDRFHVWNALLPALCSNDGLTTITASCRRSNRDLHVGVDVAQEGELDLGDTVDKLNRYGCLRLPRRGFVRHEANLHTDIDRAPKDRALTVTEEALIETTRSFVKDMIKRYDRDEDVFILDTHESLEDLDIVRLPRIGRGKHNVHFDADTSSQHRAMVAYAEAKGIGELLSRYHPHQHRFTLRETGLSLTRPSTSSSSRGTVSNPPGDYNDGDDYDDNEYEHGEGMEWHSDGSAGECTMLVSMDKIDPAMGCLHVVPGTHTLYHAAKGHTDVRPIPIQYIE